MANPDSAVPTPSWLHPAARLRTLYTAASMRLGARLLDEVLSADSLRPRMTVTKALAYVVATLVHALTFVTAAVGIFLLVHYHTQLLFVCFGILLLLIAFELRPRVPKLRETPTSPERVEALRALTAAIANRLGTSNVADIVITPEFNASMGWYGWRRRKVLRLGLPLFLTLDRPERIALLGHEFAHSVNGDANRGVYVGTALYSLQRWYGFLHWRSGRNAKSFEFIGMLIAELVSYLPRAGLFVLWHLTWRESQRAEYLADALAAQMAGSDATAALFCRLSRSGRFGDLVRQFALNRREDDLFGELRMQIPNTMPPAWSQSTIPTIAAYRLEATHPPAAYRVAFVRKRGFAAGAPIVPADAWQRVDAELATFAPEIQKQLIARYLRYLYR